LTYFNNSYANQLEGLYSSVAITPFTKPQIRHVNHPLAEAMSLPTMTQTQWLEWIFNNPQHRPIAQKYSGHQFGSYNPELGDGRGLLLGEWQSGEDKWDLHLKGAGKTPYSRMGDGRAVLRSTIREYLGSEALHHLGIPSSRALCMVTSDELVIRETVETGAMMIRVSDSHIRFGTFENYFHTGESEKLERLFDYTFKHHYPEWQSHEDRYGLLLESIVDKTARLIARWQAFGFAHGVMNTDNMSIHGITFDFGPYGFLDDYEPGFICNHSDYQGRYSFENQPSIGLWNLNMLAHAFTPHLSIESLTAILQRYEHALLQEYNDIMRQRLGFQEWQNEDITLLSRLLNQMEQEKRDYHLVFRLLSTVASSDDNNAFVDFFLDREKSRQWLGDYLSRVAAQSLAEQQRQTAMKAINPKYILRNYLLQEAIEKAQQGDFSEVDTLFSVMQHPFSEQPEYSSYADLPPDSGKHLEISCSS
jgi:uncharacterized protein YdiU (UPF0061 family)